MSAPTTFVTGGTGFIGRAVVGEPLAAGDRVQVPARGDRGEQAVRALGAEPAAGDLSTPGSWREQVRAADRVVHAAQPSTSGSRLTPPRRPPLPGRAAGPGQRAAGRGRPRRPGGLHQRQQLLMRLFAGRIGYEYLATDALYSNTRLTSLGFRFEHPTVHEGLPALLNESTAHPTR
ncbi:hypothetical protein OK074_5689 [Actinobacteria bacterium OK074]|nr:hypothetical protein OK074_5689 [Actinobacteria bacterium OK074]